MDDAMYKDWLLVGYVVDKVGSFVKAFVEKLDFYCLFDQSRTISECPSS